MSVKSLDDGSNDSVKTKGDLWTFYTVYSSSTRMCTGKCIYFKDEKDSGFNTCVIKSAFNSRYLSKLN
jgi:hypothetical protein